MMRCATCGAEFEPGRMTYWEATVWLRDRPSGGPNRRKLERTGRGLCEPCSLRLEHHLAPVEQGSLFR